MPANRPHSRQRYPDKHQRIVSGPAYQIHIIENERYRYEHERKERKTKTCNG